MYVAFHKETTKFLRVYKNGMWQNVKSATKAGATRAINTAAAKGKIVAEDYAVLHIDEFLKIEKTEVVRNLMSGKEVVQSVNTPRCCDVSSELYWTM
jgi:hypothetical protein